MGVAASDEQTFPVKVGPDLTFNSLGREYDGFVAKVKAGETELTTLLDKVDGLLREVESDGG